MFPFETNILLADDTEITRSIIRKMLFKLGFRKVIEAADGEAAWVELEKGLNSGKPIQLVICDWNMPKVNGLQVLKQMQEDPLLHTVPFILLTSNTEKGQVVQAIRSGVTTYLAKPFPVPVLDKKLAEAWSNRFVKQVG